MGLIKKSVSDIERKIEYARIVMRVLKACHLVKEFIDYANTQDYRSFSKVYKEKHSECCNTWYDRELCGDILGTCSFSSFLDKKTFKKHNPYLLLLSYLAIFNKNEFDRYSATHSSCGTSQKYINRVLNNQGFEQGDKDIEIVKKWITLKNVLYGDKN